MVAICISNGLVSRRGAKIGLCLIKHDNAINRLLQKIVGCSMPQRHMSDIIRDQQPVVLSPETSIRDACRQMQKRRIGAILVAHSDGHLVGIFTGRDAVCRVLAEGLDAASTKLADVMTKNPDTITPEKTAMDALLQMQDGGYRHIPIVADGRITGIVSRGDFRGAEKARLDEETGFAEKMR